MTWLLATVHNYDRLYAQIFQSQTFIDALAKCRVQDGMFPARLRFDQVMYMEIIVSRTMLPNQSDMWSVLTSLVMLKIVICELHSYPHVLYVADHGVVSGRANPQYLSEVNVMLQPLASLKHLTVVFSVRDTVRALRTVSTWSSHSRSKLDSTLLFVFNFMASSRGTLPHSLYREAMLQVMDGIGANPLTRLVTGTRETEHDLA